MRLVKRKSSPAILVQHHMKLSQGVVLLLRGEDLLISVLVVPLSGRSPGWRGLLLIAPLSTLIEESLVQPFQRRMLRTSLKGTRPLSRNISRVGPAPQSIAGRAVGPTVGPLPTIRECGPAKTLVPLVPVGPGRVQRPRHTPLPPRQEVRFDRLRERWCSLREDLPVDFDGAII